MPLSLLEQFNVASTSWVDGDINLLSKMLVSPDAVTLEEQRTVAEKLGFKGGFLQAVVNIVADPTIWVAFMLSRRFPTAQYLKGVIPQRLIGASNEFTGISSATRTVEGFFRGTNIPSIISLQMKRRAEVLQIGNKIFDKVAVRPNWKEEMPVVSMLLEGQRPAGATPELNALAGDIRGHMDQLWEFLAKTRSIKGGFTSPQGITRATSGPFMEGKAPRYLRDYLPHIPLTGPESVMNISGREALGSLSRGKLGQYLQTAKEDPSRIWSITDADRLSSTFEQYQGFMQRVGGQVFNPRLFQRKRLGLTVQSAADGEGLFVTDLNVILQKYIDSVARTYALNAPLTEAERSIARTFITNKAGRAVTLHPSAEPPVVQVINEGLDAAGPLRMVRKPVVGTNVMEEFIDQRSLNAPTLGALRTLVREFKGQADAQEALIGNLWNTVRYRATRSLKGVISKDKMDQIEDAVSSVQRDAAGRDVTRRITSFFYATTLGVNASSSMKNLFQPFLTTVPALGIGPTLAGYKTLKERVPRYVSEFFKQRRLLESNRKIPMLQRMNLAQERAFGEVFPELARAGIRADPRAFEMSEATLIEEALTGRTKFKNSDALYKFLLQPFTQTELSNQVVTFFGAKEALKKAVRIGELDVPVVIGTERALTGAAFDDFLNLEAASLVNSTQFRPGPGARTVLQTMIPAPFRMFTTFPLRLGNYFAESTVRGALTESQLRDASFFTRLTGGRNLGTLARTYGIGRAVTQGLRSALGVDMGDAMGVTGPFTGIVSSGRVFSPLTFSPLPSVAVSMVSYASTRDARDLNPVSLPVLGEIPFPKTLVPGGIAITRAVKALRAYKPDLGGFVDEDERLMFRGDTTDVVLSMLGIPLEKERRMREAMDRVGANRLRVRTLRRKYAVAARNYDTEEMTSLEGTFSKEFPEVGRLGVSRQDLRRYDEAARITSVQRMLKSLGKRFSYLESDLYEFDPDLVAGGVNDQGIPR